MPGESAQQRYERMRERRRESIRDKIPLVVAVVTGATLVGAVVGHALFGMWWLGAAVGGGFVLAGLAAPQRERAWRKGAEGERIVGKALDRLRSPTVHVVHDRLIPASRANIDHLVVTSRGVWTVDAKHYEGRIEVRRAGELRVGGRDRSKLLDQVRRQTQVVREVLSASGHRHVPVRPALCFVGVEWPLLFPPKHVDDVYLVAPRRLRGLMGSGEDVLSPSEIAQVATVLETALEPAASKQKS